MAAGRIPVYSLLKRKRVEMTTANKITIFRILLVPVFIVEILYYFRNGNEIHRLMAILSFGLASILDGVDGYVARHYNQRSELGAILDPLGDKLLLASGVVLLSLHPSASVNTARIPLWVTVTIISRDFLLLVGIILIQVICGHSNVRPRVLGKISTVLQMAMVLWVLLIWDKNWIPFWTTAAGVCTGISGLLYLYDWMAQLGTNPSSLPQAGQGQDTKK